ncbi:MAG: tetratricopeptide repeat protein [Thermoanaerobaculia bacterium]
MRRTRKRALSAPLLLVWGACSVSSYQTFDGRADLERRYIERLGPERAAEVRIPFDLTPELEAAIDSRLSPAGGEKRRTEEILDFIFSGLGLRYALTPTRDAAETFEARQANCLSFVHLFVGIARRQRLNPFYVEVEDYQRWNYRDGAVVSQGHIVAGMYLDGELSTFDFLPYQPKSYRQFRPIDDLTAMAHHYNNVGAEALLAGDLDRARELLEIAYRLAPDFTKAVNNLGVLMLRSGEVDDAVALYERTLELHPDNVPLLSNLARAYQAQGRVEEARQLLQRIADTDASNPFLHIYRGEAALAEGDAARALESMRRALRADSGLPEVHVGLVKVYLALGELRKARHHVERALRLDATDEEARHYAELLARGAS